MEVSGRLHAPAALPRGNNPRYTLDRRLGGPQSLFGRGGEEQNSQPLPGIEPRSSDRPARSQTESSRLISLSPHPPWLHSSA
jgi:hypothetical protein